MARKQQPDETDITRPAVTGRPDQSRMRRVAEAQENALAKGTQTVYYKHWKAFNDWCFDNAYRALPAHVDTVSPLPHRAGRHPAPKSQLSDPSSPPSGTTTRAWS